MTFVLHVVLVPVLLKIFNVGFFSKIAVGKRPLNVSKKQIKCKISPPALRSAKIFPKKKNFLNIALASVYKRYRALTSDFPSVNKEYSHSVTKRYSYNTTWGKFLHSSPKNFSLCQ